VDQPVFVTAPWFRQCNFETTAQLKNVGCEFRATPCNLMTLRNMAAERTCFAPGIHGPCCRCRESCGSEEYADSSLLGVRKKFSRCVMILGEMRKKYARFWVEFS
jgi:hypothetical protein